MSEEKNKENLLDLKNEEYQISSRKWRPQTFDDVVGQEVIKRELKNGILRGQIANAYLFSGPRGIGKTSMARIFAKALNCEKGPTVNICNICPQCVSITKGSSMDVIEIDGASYTKVENIRELQEGVGRAPYSARYKVYIIDEVHMLSTNSFNALLKTLEEPPRHVVFIFATTNPEKIPETVVSRCRHHQFTRIETQDIIKRLELILNSEKNITISPEEKKKILETIAISSEGGMRDAQVTLDQLLTLSDGKISLDDVEQLLGLVDTGMFFDIIYDITRKDTKHLILLVNKIVQMGRDIERLVKSMIQFIRDLLILRSGGDHSLVSLFGENLNHGRKIASNLSYPFLLNLLNQFFILEEKLKSTNLPSRFLLEFTLIKLTAIEPSIDIDHILKELKAIPDSGMIKISGKSECKVDEGSALQSMPDESAPFNVQPSTLIESMEMASTKTTYDTELTNEDSQTANEENSPYTTNSENPQEMKGEAIKNQIWEKCLREAKKQYPVLHSTLIMTKPINYDGDRFFISADKSHTFTRKAFEKKENIKYIEEILTKIIGHSVRLKIEFIEKKTQGQSQLLEDTKVKDTEIKYDTEDENNKPITQVDYKKPKIAMPDIDPETMKQIKIAYMQKAYKYDEAIDDHPDFKEKIDLVVSFFKGKITHFNEAPIK